MAWLDAKKRKEQVNQEKWENAEDAESVVAVSEKVCRKVLGNVVIKQTVKAGSIVQRNFLACKRKRP